MEHIESCIREDEKTKKDKINQLEKKKNFREKYTEKNLLNDSVILVFDLISIYANRWNEKIIRAL